jgi:hypothetical protein
MEVYRDRAQVSALNALLIAVFTMLALFSSGCSTEEETNPTRSATEQLLLSSAADQAMSKVNLNLFSDHKIYLDFSNFEGYDAKYAEEEIRDVVNRAGALLIAEKTNADIIIEASAGAYSIDTNSFYIGIPSITLPIPGTAETPLTPRIAFYSKDSQDSYAKINLLAYSGKTGAFIFSSGPLDGQSYKTYRTFLLFSWWRTDVPEKVNPKYKQDYVVWPPQYGLTNEPPPPPSPKHRN